MDVLELKYNDLSLDQMHDLLQLRSLVFVVEQDCVYQDIDGKDRDALHILGYEKDKLVAYTRCFPAGKYFEMPSIGRVVVHPDRRGSDLGREIMKASIEAVYRHFGKGPIKLSAQTYLLRFYNSLGFSSTGKEYLEDGIPHIAMTKP